jgi:membrane-bound lytic murein transglycosylase D
MTIFSLTLSFSSGIIHPMKLFKRNVPKYLVLSVLSCNLLSVSNSSKAAFAALETTSQSQNSSSNQSDSIWSSMSQEFKLNHATNLAQVQAEIRKLQAHPEGLYHALQSAGPYIYYVYQQTQAHGLPAELALLPVIESEYNPNNRSGVGALGLWQLMPKTASELGVKVKPSYDGRRDVIASTQAALTYLGDLGRNFAGNWYLAIGAYNCGPGAVHHASRKSGSTNFWNLPLPKETREYVPKLLAVAAVVKDPARYGMVLPPVSNQPYFTEVKMDKPVNLTTVAHTTGVNIATLNKLNPDYAKTKGSVPAAKDGAYTLLVPIDQAYVVKAKFSENNNSNLNSSI